MTPEEYRAGLLTELTPFAFLRAAVEANRDDAALRAIIRLLGRGWTLPLLDGTLADVVNEEMLPDHALVVIHLYAHLDPVDFLCWLDTFGGDLVRLDDLETLHRIDTEHARRAAQGSGLAEATDLAG